MNHFDARRVHQALATLCEVFLQAGAHTVFPFVAGQPPIQSKSDILRFRSQSLRPGDFSISAYHPLGTCRIGVDPKRSCLGPDHQSHETSGLYVVDGSAVPSSLGANPQLTIMAMALRAAEGIDSVLG
jgi:choline dehydrogenase-like flavoprotein